MKPATDDTLLRAIREAAATHGYGNRARVMQEAAQQIQRAGRWPEGQHALRARLNAVWAEQIEISGAN